MRNDFPLLSPCCIHLFQRKMISLGEQPSDITGRPVRVDAPLLHQKLVDGFAIAENNDGGRADFQAENGTIFLSPCAKSVAIGK